MNPFSLLRSVFIWATQVLVDAALMAYGSMLPLDWLGDVFNWLSDFTSDAAGYFFGLANWYDELIQTIQEFLSWENIQALIRGWLANIEEAIAWFLDWWSQVGQRIDTWWTGVTGTVQGWIDGAVQGLDDLKAAWNNFWAVTLPGIFNDIASLWAEWSNFWTVTFPTLITQSGIASWWSDRIQDVQNLIDTAFTLHEELWAGWQEIRASVVEFFADPLKWLYDRLEDFMDRYW